VISSQDNRITGTHKNIAPLHRKKSLRALSTKKHSDTDRQEMGSVIAEATEMQSDKHTQVLPQTTTKNPDLHLSVRYLS